MIFLLIFLLTIATEFRNLYTPKTTCIQAYTSWPRIPFDATVNKNRNFRLKEAR